MTGQDAGRRGDVREVPSGTPVEDYPTGYMRGDGTPYCPDDVDRLRDFILMRPPIPTIEHTENGCYECGWDAAMDTLKKLVREWK